jgi:zinc protease
MKPSPLPVFAIGIIVALMASASMSPARGAEQPTVDSILAKYVTALGGKAAHDKVTSRVLKIKVESEAFGASDAQVYAKAPNKQLSHVDLPDSAVLEEGFDGEVAWAKSPWEGLRVKSGDELAKTKRDADFNQNLRLKILYPDLAYKGTEKIGEEDAYVLEAKPSSTSTEKFWFSTKTGLVLRRDSTFTAAQGPVETSVLVQGYQTIEGIKYPEKLKMKFSAGGQAFEMSMKYLEVQHNVKIEDAKFAKPSA